MEIIPELVAFGKNNVAKYPDLAKRVTFLRTARKTVCPNTIPLTASSPPHPRKKFLRRGKNRLPSVERLWLPVDEDIRVLTKIGEVEFEEKVFPGFIFVPFVRKTN